MIVGGEAVDSLSGSEAQNCIIFGNDDVRGSGHCNNSTMKSDVSISSSIERVQTIAVD